MEKRFFDVFTKYNPSPDKRELLERGHSFSHRVVSREPLRVEVNISFDSHEEPELFYDIEDECRELYAAETFKIFPHFPPSSFNVCYFNEIAAEAAIYGAVTHGFFSNADFTDDGETITAYIPFSIFGVDFVKNADTEKFLSNVLYNRYGITRKIDIRAGEGAEEYSTEWKAKREKMLEDAEAANRAALDNARATAQRERDEQARAADPHFDFERKSGISHSTGVNEKISDTEFRIGASVYSIEESDLIFGDDFDITAPTPLADIERTHGNAAFFGTVFEIETKETRKGDKTNVTVGISDGASATYLKRTLGEGELDWLGSIKSGMSLAVFGRVINDKFDNEPFISFRGIRSIKKKQREDRAPEKRVELHLHSNMSQMDALITPKDIVNTAIRWGHKAIAVTDHGNVQAFPEVMLALEKSKNTELKILYGIEAYFVNDTAKCMFGKRYPSFDDEMVVFDIETTGFYNRTCKIIEIGAVKIKGGKVIEEMDIFVDPEQHIPDEITALTSITDEMVAGAPKEREAVEQFLAFVGDRMLIAHNANFDVGFIRVAAERHGIPFDNTYLDTVGLSRYVNPELKNHKLDTIAKAYALEEFHHHRASDDARTLAEIFFVMLSRLREEGVGDFPGMLEQMSEHTDPLKLMPYHMIIFAQTRDGLRNLYRLISYSYLDYYGGFGRQKKVPRIPKSVLEDYREGLIIGSACEAGELYAAIRDGKPQEEIEEIASFYDYLEIQPLCNNAFLVREGKVASEDALRDINRQIYELGKKLGKPVCATCDAHFLNAEDEVLRRVLTANMYKDADEQAPLYLRTTDEMLAEFAYLGEDVAHEVVIENPNKIADMIDRIRPIPEGRYDPIMPGANEELTESCWRRAHDWYGEKLPEIVEKRLAKELDSIIKNNFAGLYMISVKLVAYSESLGYLVGSRGSVGSSLVATMSGISEVNPLPPHYRCLKCKHSEFFTDGSVGSGFDLDDKRCPVCGEWMYQDGQDIPFETFLGFKGDKSPDIDLNFSGDVQGRVHKYTEELFGQGHVFRAGTIGTLAQKTAWGYVNKYLEERKIKISKAEISHLATNLVGVKRTTGQHPGGIIVVPKEYEIYDFTPVQHPADDPNSDIITTHFQFSYLHDTILKLDELGHDIPTKYKMLENYTGTSVLDVKMNDKSIYELFASTDPLKIKPEDIGGCLLGTYGIPEMGTKFIQQVLLDAKPKNFADLLQISGLTHGTDVWLGNAQELIKKGVCTISEVVGTRDGIMLYLISKGIDDSTSFKIMESVRKGKGLTPEWEEIMLSNGVPDWYIWSCKKIKYMFPKAHAAAYDMSAIRLGWYKIYYPMEFYAAFFTVAPGGFDAEIVGKGYVGVNAAIKELEEKDSQMESTQKDKELLATLYLVREAMARGVQFLSVDLKKSDASAFLPENGKIRMPFNSLSGLGDGAAEKIIKARDSYNIYSIEDLRERSGVSKTVIEVLRRNHVLDGLSETNQFTLF
ncbi:MAG: PolC-type DNA polymerase III [Clostridia bacterium]|nr:PolC-type DNA polymerase III [Clostridia bacterium]